MGALAPLEAANPCLVVPVIEKQGKEGGNGNRVDDLMRLNPMFAFIRCLPLAAAAKVHAPHVIRVTTRIDCS